MEREEVKGARAELGRDERRKEKKGERERRLRSEEGMKEMKRVGRLEI